MQKARYTISASIAVGAFLGIAAVAFAANDAAHQGHAPSARPIVGTVSSVNGSALALLVTSSSTASVTTYTVDDSNAKVLKSGASAAASAITVSDRIAVIGSVSGDEIAAKLIIDGFMPHNANAPPFGEKGGRAGSGIGRSFASSTRPFGPGSMKPAAFGAITSISGSSFDIAEGTKAGTTTIAIDTDSSTTYREGTTTASFSTLAVGNLVAVTGTTTAADELLASRVLILPTSHFGRGFPKSSGWNGKGHFKMKAASTDPGKSD